jgi:hypothetical protein
MLNRNDLELDCKPSTTLGVTHGYGRIFAALDSRACRRVEGAPNAVSGMSGRFAAPIAVGRGYEGNNFQCPSETTSTVPSVTLMAVWSSIAYAGPAISATHLSASAMVFPGMSS